MEDEKEYDPCLNYLKILKLKQTIKNIISEIDRYSMEAVKYKESMTKLKCYIAKIGEPFITPDTNIYRIVVCRNDGTKLRIPKDKSWTTVKCPKCGYKFVADSTNNFNIIEQKRNRAKKRNQS